MQKIQIGEEAHSLAHLKGLVVEVPKTGGSDENIRVEVTLGLHTISLKCENGSHDMIDEKGNPRTFCPIRYKFSLGLPALIRSMIQQNFLCWESADRNRGVNYAIVNSAPLKFTELQNGDYHVIFFYIYPSKVAGIDVRLFVASCHERPMAFDPKKRRYNMHTVVRKCHFSQKRLP